MWFFLLNKATHLDQLCSLHVCSSSFYATRPSIMSSQTTILANLDDTVLLGPPHAALDAFASLKQLLLPLGLVANDCKCEMFCSSTDCQSQDIPCSSEGMEILGCPLGSRQFISSHCVGAAKSGSAVCLKILLLKISDIDVLAVPSPQYSTY